MSLLQEGTVLSGKSKRHSDPKILSFQTDVNDESGWQMILRREGLVVVDVYSSWAGPCTSMIGILKRVRSELNDSKLHFATACSDDIIDLLMFKDQSEPSWLFIGGGKPVKIFRGSNAPNLSHLIKAELAREILCMAGKEARRTISIDDEASRRKKAEKEMRRLVGILKENEEQQAAEDLSKARKASSLRLMEELTPFTVLVIQPFLIGQKAERDIRSQIVEEFRIEQDLMVDIDETRARQLYKIPYDEFQPVKESAAKSSTSESSQVGHHKGPHGQKSPRGLKSKKPRPTMTKVSIPVPDQVMGKTLMLLLENKELKKMTNAGISPPEDSLLQTGDDYIRLKVGPINLTDAKVHAPYSLHATYGQGDRIPGVWCPRTYDDKRHVMIHYFPEFTTEVSRPDPIDVPKYFVAIFPGQNVEKISNELIMFKKNYLAEDTKVLDKNAIDEILKSCRNDQQLADKKSQLINQKVYAICTDLRKGHEIIDVIKFQHPVHKSLDSRAGKREAALIFPELGISQEPTVPEQDEIIQEFISRSKKRIPSETDLGADQKSGYESASPFDSSNSSAPSTGDESQSESMHSETEPLSEDN